MRILLLVPALVLCFCAISATQGTRPGAKKSKKDLGNQVYPEDRELEDSLRGVKSYKPAKGFVPDETTAVRIAEAVLIPIYGEGQIRSERPFKARLRGEIWLVSGTVPAGFVGGAAVVKIAKSDGRIVFVTHQE